MKRILFLCIASIFLLGCGGGAETAVGLTEAEQAEVYTAVIRQNVTVDDTFGGELNPPLIYIITQTNDAVGDPEIAQEEPEQLSDELQNQITAGLADLGAEIVWVNDRESVEIEPDSGRVANEGVIVTVGNIHEQEDGTLRVSSSIYIAGLAAGGQTYILTQTNGQWSVTGDTGFRWIS